MMARFGKGGRNRSRSPIKRGPSNKRGKKDFDMSFAAPKWNIADLPKFEKCFYQEHPISASRPESEINGFRAMHKMTLSGPNIPRPVFSFEELNLPEYILRVIRQNGWHAPTPIQAQGVPMGLAGRDVVGIAQTGSGKTASFIIPALVHIAAQPRLLRGDGPICLILVPTRELAQQVLAVAQEFAGAANMRTMCFYGGSARGPQMREMHRGAEICIATPGRLIDFIRSEGKLMSRVTYLVLDEADRMLDMGFEPQIRKIIAHIRPDRQTLMWSATWPREVQTLARDFLNDYIQVNIGSVSLHANPNITQIVEIVDEWNKEQRLIELLNVFGGMRCLVFVETKRKTDQITYSLRRRGYAVGAMHGDKQQRDREMTLKDFRDGRINVLVATDVASRGLDIDDIQYVVNFDFPNQTEDYIHRIGRTARSDKKGTAFTFFTSKHMKQAKELVDILEEANQEVNPELFHMAGISDTSRRGGFKKKNQPFNSNTAGRFGHSSMSSSVAPRFSTQDRPPAFTGGSTGYQNGSSLHKPNAAPANIQSMQNSFAPAPNSGLPGSGGFQGGGLPNPPANAYPGFGASQPRNESRAPENAYTNAFNPIPPGNAPPGGTSKWDRRPLPPNATGLTQPVPAEKPQPPANPTAGSNWTASQWGDARGPNGNQGSWNVIPPQTIYPPSNSTFPQQPPTALPGRRPSEQSNQPFVSDGVPGMPSRGSSGNLKSCAAPPNTAYAQSWANYPQQPFPQSAPPPPQPTAQNWDSGWAQPYYGNY